MADAGVVIDEDSMAMTKSAAFRILSTQAYRRAFTCQGAVSKQFGESPVNRAIVQYCISPCLHEFFYLRIDSEILRYRCQSTGDVFEQVTSHSCIDEAVVTAGKPFPHATQGGRWESRRVAFDGIEGGLQPL